MNNKKILEIENLKTGFYQGRDLKLALDDISLFLDKGEILGVVGESGSGKSVTALSIMGLIDGSQGKIQSGSIKFEGQEISNLSKKNIRSLRGHKIAMIFQEPMTSLNPLFTIGFQIGEALALHMGLRGNSKKARIIELLDKVKIPDAPSMIHKYPHELSGGMRQRVMIAMAISCEPSLLIADEPTTALDVTVQAQILNLLSDLQDTLGMSMILITHDLGVVAKICHRVMVMYGGKVMEEGLIKKVFKSPSHPYTFGLLNSIPKIGKKVTKLNTIEGVVPSLGHFPKGCRFLTRCTKKSSSCENHPQKKEVEQGHQVSCFHPMEG